MKRRLIYALLLLFLVSPGYLFAQSQQPQYPDGEGFYKDLFIDSGPSILSMAGRSHANHLGWHWEEFSSFDNDQTRARFTKIMAGTEDDTNGILLFPDGKPRFRMMMIAAADGAEMGASWIGGGGRHIKALEQSGFDQNQNGITRIQQFVRAGGGYAGFCAGFLMTDDLGLVNGSGQHHINYPLESFTATLTSSHFGMDLPYTLQLGGGYYHDADLIPGLTLAGKFKLKSGNHYEYYPALWTYEHPDFPDSGHLVLSGGHPEQSPATNSNAFMAKLLTYAVAGNHEPELKTTLENGSSWGVYEETGSPDLAHIKIGDGQYHHYRFDVPAADEGKTLRITLTQDERDVPSSDLHLFLNQGQYAFNAEGYNLVKDLSPGFEKVMILENVTEGAWYLSVKGATYPDPFEQNATEYTANRHVLNGVGYTLIVEWATTFCDEGLSVADINEVVCSGGTIPLTYTAADCLEDPIQAALLNAQGDLVTHLSGSFNNGAGTHQVNLSVPSHINANQYRLQMTSGDIIAVTENLFTIGDKTLTDPFQSAEKVSKGGQIRLTWQAGCAFDPSEKTKIQLIQQNTSDVVFEAYQNEPRPGLNGTYSSLNVDPGAYYFVISAAGETLIFPPLEVLGGNILSLTTDATAFAGYPMNVGWQIDAGMNQRSGRLTLRDAGMRVISVLATHLNLASGIHSTQFAIDPDLLSTDLIGARLHLISEDGLTQRISAPFNLMRNVLSLVNPLPATLYTGQQVSVAYQLGVTLPANETLSARWVDEQGAQLYQSPTSLANQAGTHTVMMPLSVGSAKKVRLQIVNQSGAIQTESTLVSVQTADLTFGGYDHTNRSISWQWIGEDNCQLDVMVMDDATYATIAMDAITQNTGTNSYTIHAQLISGRSYSVILQTKNRSAPIVLWRQFTAP